MKNNFFRLDVGLLLLTFATLPALAAPEPEDKNPLGCRDVGYQFTLKTLDLLPEKEGASQSLYFLYNKTTKPINLYQMRNPNLADGMSINHTIPAQRWAVLSINDKATKYACTVSDGKHAYGELVDCGQSLKICEFVRVKYGLNNRGNFWMVIGNSKNGALREVTNYGVIAR